MSKFVLVLLGLGLGSASLYAISVQTSNTSGNSTKTDTTKIVIVTEKIPGMNCICKASDGCKNPMTAKYECSNSPIQQTPSTSPVITPTQTNSVIVTEPIPGASCICKASDGCKNLATRRYECSKSKTTTSTEVYVTKCSCIQVQKDGSPKVDKTGGACKNLQTAILKCTPISK